MGTTKTYDLAFKTAKNPCPECEWLALLFSPENNRDYWIYTEIFMKLHNGKDYCDYEELSNGK